MRIAQVDLELQREPFARPFGFKGAQFHEKWNAVVRLRDDAGRESFGLGGLSPLWADANIFLAHTENGGNFLMLAILEHALQLVKGASFTDPMTFLDEVLPATHEYGKLVTRNDRLSLTFTLNALVALDNALWILYAREQGGSFDGLIPPAFRGGLAQRQERVAVLPLLTYGCSAEEIKSILDEGYFFLKIKIGQPGTEAQMLQKDIARLSAIHAIAREYETPMTDNGKVLYYLDANGRYREKDSLRRLLDHAEKIGCRGQIALIEEPFAEELSLDVRDIHAPLAADESVHAPGDIGERIAQGYAAIAVKPAGKTLSTTFRMIEAARRHGVTCYVADNACVPVLVDWNKNVAARLPAFPGLKCGVMESNGPVSYPDWDRLLENMPCAGASWLKPRNGVFHLDADFYGTSGGIFLPPASYVSLFHGSV